MGRRPRPNVDHGGYSPPRDRTAPPSAASAPPRSWRTHLPAVAVIGGLALAYRAALLAELAGTPYLEVARVDSRSYQLWALGIAAGQWWPTQLFYQAPFYAYFLGVIYHFFGPGPWAPRVIQVLLGSLSPVLLYAIGTRLFSRRVGWIAGLVLALYGPLILEEITLSKTSPLVFLAIASFAAYAFSVSRARSAGLALAGALSGLAVVAAAQWMLPFVALAVVTPFLATGEAGGRRWLGALSFALCGTLVIAPVVAWNSAQGGGFILTAGGAGLNLYSGNNPRASALPAPPDGVRDIPEYEDVDARLVAERQVGQRLNAAQVERYWSGRAAEFIREQPREFAALMVKKITALWNAYEIPDNYHYAFMREHFLPLLWLAATFAIVAPLALLGLVVARGRNRTAWALYVVCLAYLLTPLIYYVRGRYRLPAVPFLIVFAGVGVDRVLALIAARRWPAVATSIAAVLAAGAFVNHVHCESPRNSTERRCLGGQAWYDVEWNDLGVAVLESGMAERAMEAFRAAIALRPSYAEARNNLGSALRAQGRIDEAIIEYEEAVRINPSDFGALNNLGSAMAALGRVDEGLAWLDVALRMQPSAELHYNLGLLLVELGRPAEAVEQFTAALELKSNHAETHVKLGLALVAQGRVDEAVPAFARGLELQPGDAEAHYTVATVLLENGRTEPAATYLRAALSLAPDHAGAHNNLGALLLGQGLHGDAVEHFRAALRLQPDDADVQGNLALALELDEQYAEAAGAYEAMLRMRPDDATGHRNFAVLLGRLGRTAEADRYLARAAELARQDAEASRVSAP